MFGTSRHTLGSLGESVSGYHAYLNAKQISEDDKLENGLLRLVESLERKRDSGTRVETLIINESNNLYTGDTANHP